MLLGYVSDERYVAIPDVSLAIDGEKSSCEARSRADGAVLADVTAGETLHVTLAKQGFGPKRVEVVADANCPHQFRLLSDQLLGYAWPKWLKSGQQSEFRVHACEQYKITLWRYGLEKEFIRNLGWYDEHGPGATWQITPDGDYTQTGVTWNKRGYASPHHKQFVTAPDRAGLYYFHAQNLAAVTGDPSCGRQAEFGFPWIVAPREPQSPVAVLLSNINWNAYNNFGGRSNYIHPDRLPPTPTVNARLELKRYTDPENIVYDTEDYAPLSFDRPEPINHIRLLEQATDPIEGRAACHVAPAEWRLLAWLEREGFSQDVYAESQLHFDELPLDRYRVIVLTCHPEYWSSKMYFDLKRWVFERGGRLLYLGGNGLNCAVEFDDAATMRVRNGDLRRFKQRGVASRFALYHESEANLLGVAYDDRGIMTAAPYEVIDSRHWVFEGTSLRQGDHFGTMCLHQRVPGGASGHESDKISADSPANVQLLARGLNPNGGGAEMVLHEPAGGGAVFSAGSITYISSLLVDEGVSKITGNVLRRFLR